MLTVIFILLVAAITINELACVRCRKESAFNALQIMFVLMFFSAGLIMCTELGMVYSVCTADTLQEEIDLLEQENREIECKYDEYQFDSTCNNPVAQSELAVYTENVLQIRMLREQQNQISKFRYYLYFG